MLISESIAALSLMTTVIVSAVGVAHYFGRKHSEIIVEMVKVRSDMRTVAQAWEQRLFEAIQQLKQEVADGPRWMVERLEKYDAQLQKVVEDASISIEVAKQHGEEMNHVRTMLAESDNRNEERHNLILTILQSNGQAK